MARRFTDGTFALGLTIGICLTLVFCLLLAVVGPTDDARNASQYARANEQVQLDEDPDHSSMWRWDGALVTSSDTLAQWVMMAFSVIAAALLLGTLIVTQRMARDTRSIGQAQARAYLAIDSCTVVFDSGTDDIGFSFSVRNAGQSPARNVRLTFNVRIMIFGVNGDQAEEVVRVVDIAGGSAEVCGKMLRSEGNHNRLSPYFGEKDVFISAAARIEAKDVFGDPISVSRVFALEGAPIGPEIDGATMVYVDDIGDVTREKSGP